MGQKPGFLTAISVNSKNDGRNPVSFYQKPGFLTAISVNSKNDGRNRVSFLATGEILPPPLAPICLMSGNFMIKLKIVKKMRV
ncbi:hypothetical protein L2E67_22005 [Planktothrix agardhii 1803]|uniref:hypothetical protein n=1 Tax=Planktothrix agardhii TaxID=1160 RepID=UPI001F36AB15|nr:hypothetical protein [Planktothrix agardhii]MCF3573609.1 hypothetical protein [Planktothrix agardhii 1805]MCF3587744.1 hypothetical protein [Planktothrix agardhii 1803]